MITLGRVSNAVRFTFRWVPWVITGASLAYRRLPDKSQNEIREVAKEPRKWGEGIGEGLGCFENRGRSFPKDIRNIGQHTDWEKGQ